MIFSPAVFPRSGFSAFARYTNSAFENYTTFFHFLGEMATAF